MLQHFSTQQQQQNPFEEFGDAAPPCVVSSTILAFDSNSVSLLLPSVKPYWEYSLS